MSFSFFPKGNGNVIGRVAGWPVRAGTSMAGDVQSRREPESKFKLSIATGYRLPSAQAARALSPGFSIVLT